MSQTARQSVDDQLNDIWAAATRQLRVRLPVAAGVPAAQLATARFDNICIALIEGFDSFAKSPASPAVTPEASPAAWRVEARLRMQWVLCTQWRLHSWFTPPQFVASWRAFDETLLDDKSNIAVRAASLALLRATRQPWATAFTEALQATRAVLQTSPRSTAAADTLPVANHPTGTFAVRTLTNTQCGACTWAYTRGTYLACRQVDAATIGANHQYIDPQWPACERFEPTLDCQPCGACCREAFQTVQVGPREPIRLTHPAMVIDHGNRRELRRIPTDSLDLAADKPPATRCASLGGGELVQLGPRTTVAPYACQIYDARPQSCRSFTASSESCLIARRRVGMSR